jgi:hypothetical protein
MNKSQTGDSFILTSGTIVTLTTNNISALNGSYVTIDESLVGQQLMLDAKLVPSAEGSQMLCMGLKQNTVSSYPATLYSYNGSGILRKLWIATNNINPGKLFLTITTDGVTVWGNGKTTTGGTGYNTNPLALDMIFTPAGAGIGNTFQSTRIGCNKFSSTAMGGYIRMDIPFQTQLSISLYNQLGGSLTYWLQPHVQTYPSPLMSLVTYQCRCRTFQWSCTYNNEYPLLNEQGIVNGVNIIGLKMYIIGQSGAWFEGRFRGYVSDNGFGTVPKTTTTWSGADNNTSNLPTGMINGQVVHQSTGTEDFFDSSWGWIGTSSTVTTNGVYANDNAGMLYNSNGNAAVSFTSTISVYKFFDDEIIRSNGTQYMSLTWSCGDIKQGASGAAVILGQVWYYV